VLVDVEHRERYWYPDDGGEIWVAGYHVVDASGRFVGRDALPDGLIVANVAGAVHRPEALASDGAAPGSPLVLRESARGSVQVVLPRPGETAFGPVHRVSREPLPGLQRRLPCQNRQSVGLGTNVLTFATRSPT
jgi:hypothetical protein